MIQYETKRLLLQTKDEFAFEEILQFYQENKSHLEPFEQTRPLDFYTPEYHLKTLSIEKQLTKSHRYLRLWLSLKENPNTIVGTICFSDIFRQSAYLGYKMDHRFTNRGYCYEACQKGILIMKEDYKLLQLKASVLPENSASIHLLDKLGFLCQGLENHTISINKKDVYHLRYEKLLY